MRLFLILFLCFTSFIICWSQGHSEKRKAAVEAGLMIQTTIPIGQSSEGENILKALERYKINGASVAVIAGGKIDWAEAYGVTQAKNGKPITVATLFQSASIGKIITGLAALNLVKAGAIALDQPINTKLKRWKIAENELTQQQPVTLRHLLSHSAGLTDDYGFLGYAPGTTIPTALQILKQTPPAKAKKSLAIKTLPGETERYSGAGYLIIQLLIEDLTGSSFADFVTQTILTPLNMTLTTYDNEPDKNLDQLIAPGHLGNGKGLKKKNYHIYPEKAAAGCWTTPSDLAKLVLQMQKEYHGESDLILNQELMIEMLRPQINTKGLAPNLRGINRPEAFWHAGQNLGYTGLLYGLIHRREGAIVMANSDGGEQFMQAFITSVANAYDWPVLQTAQIVTTPEKIKDDLSGSYSDQESGKGLTVILEKGQLMVKPRGASKGVPLYRVGDNHFTFKDAQDYFKLSFVWEEEHVTGLEYQESIGKVLLLTKEN